MRKADLTRAVADLIGEIGGEFGSSQIIRALPAFKPEAVRGHLHWLVSSGKLTTHRQLGVPYLIYAAPRSLDGPGEAFTCTLALIEAMRRLGSHSAHAAAPPPRAQNDIAWVHGLVERCKGRC